MLRFDKFVDNIKVLFILDVEKSSTTTEWLWTHSDILELPTAALHQAGLYHQTAVTVL